MSALPLRRFPNEIVRRRQEPGAYNNYGEWEAGSTNETILPASVQPLKLGDDDLAGGAQLVERLKVFCPVGIERHRDDGATLSWGGAAIQWGDDRLTWGADDRIETTDDPEPLVAAFDDREADKVLYDGHEFVVVESRTWPGRHCRATLLRET